MIKTKQTVLHNPEAGVDGNCFSAVLASLLHLRIEMVPIFTGPSWRHDVNRWLRKHGLAYIQLRDFETACGDFGISGCHHEIGGTTTRRNDCLHAVVGVDGVPVFDPHPDDTGLAEIQDCGVFIALEPWRGFMSTVPIAQGLVECRVMQHTPGPWRVERQNPSPTTGEWMISGAKPGYLAEVRDCGSGDVAANAKLIAAAPDLLAAIEAMRVAGGHAEFQAAFDKAKKLAMVHNAELRGRPLADGPA